MMKKIIIPFILLLGIQALYSFSFTSKVDQTCTETVEVAEKVNWLTWEEVEEKMRTEKRKVFVDVYTDWCGWCKKMDVATFQQPHIAKYLNENYYAVKFNAEQKEAITLKEKVYKFNRNGKRGHHELAVEIMRNKLSYPTIVFLDEEIEVIQAIPGFQDPEKFEMIMTYFAGNNHKKISWSKYSRTYKPISKN